jgi:hypothetical protein
MYRTLLATALATALIGTVSADAATRNKHHPRAARAVQLQHPSAYPEFPSRPRWAAPQQCFTDDGYGRYTPCEGGGKGY